MFERKNLVLWFCLIAATAFFYFLFHQPPAPDLKKPSVRKTKVRYEDISNPSPLLAPPPVDEDPPRFGLHLVPPEPGLDWGGADALMKRIRKNGYDDVVVEAIQHQLMGISYYFESPLLAALGFTQDEGFDVGKLVRAAHSEGLKLYADLSWIAVFDSQSELPSEPEFPFELEPLFDELRSLGADGISAMNVSPSFDAAARGYAAKHHWTYLPQDRSPTYLEASTGDSILYEDWDEADVRQLSYGPSRTPKTRLIAAIFPKDWDESGLRPMPGAQDNRARFRAIQSQPNGFLFRWYVGTDETMPGVALLEELADLAGETAVKPVLNLVLILDEETDLPPLGPWLLRRLIKPILAGANAAGYDIVVSRAPKSSATAFAVILTAYECDDEIDAWDLEAPRAIPPEILALLERPDPVLMQFISPLPELDADDEDAFTAALSLHNADFSLLEAEHGQIPVSGLFQDAEFTWLEDDPLNGEHELALITMHEIEAEDVDEGAVIATAKVDDQTLVLALGKEPLTLINGTTGSPELSWLISHRLSGLSRLEAPFNGLTSISAARSAFLAYNKGPLTVTLPPIYQNFSLTSILADGTRVLSSESLEDGVFSHNLAAWELLILVPADETD